MLEQGARAVPWRQLTRELAIGLTAYAAYFAGRGATQGEASVALENARPVMAFEQGLGSSGKRGCRSGCSRGGRSRTDSTGKRF